MEQALEEHRLHFAFTVMFHYLFPQLTMELALLLAYLKTKALRTGDEHYKPRGTILGAHFRNQFRPRRSDGNPDGVSVRGKETRTRRPLVGGISRFPRCEVGFRRETRPMR